MWKRRGKKIIGSLKRGKSAPRWAESILSVLYGPIRKYRHTAMTHHDSAFEADLLFEALKNEVEVDRIWDIYVHMLFELESFDS